MPEQYECGVCRLYFQTHRGRDEHQPTCVYVDPNKRGGNIPAYGGSAYPSRVAEGTCPLKPDVNGNVEHQPHHHVEYHYRDGYRR